MSLAHTVISSGPLLEEASVQGSRGVAAPTGPAVAGQRVRAVWGKVSVSGTSVHRGLLRQRSQHEVRSRGHGVVRSAPVCQGLA